MIKQKLPKNWIVLESKTHPDRVYYFNTKTNQSSWEEPTEDQSKQVTRKSAEPPQKRKKVFQEDDIGGVKPITPQHNVSEKEISERKKLTAKRSLRRIQEKINEEKETPQMRLVREKLLKEKEKKGSKSHGSKSSKDSMTSSPVKSDNSRTKVIHKCETDSSSKLGFTPQMQAVFEKMQKKVSKRVSKMKKTKESKSDDIKHKRDKPIKLQHLRNQGICSQQNIVSKFPSLLEKRNQIEKQESPKVDEKKATSKKTNEECDLIEPMRQSRKSVKKNLGKERMEKLRKSLTSEINNDESSDCTSHMSTSSFPVDKRGKLSSICKNAEVRLVRLKDKFSKDKISINKNLQIDEVEEKEKLSEKSVTTVNVSVERSNHDSFYEEMDWEPMEDEKITSEVQAVRTQLCTENNTNVPCNISNGILKYPLLSEQQEKKQVYIVVDTNVFLSNIEVVELVRETTFRTYEQPLIVIPWTVIRELDYIKDNNGRTKPAMLCAKARKAVNYINKLFSSKHPRVIGQTPEDVAKNKEKFSIDCPDDEILQTCLQIRDLKKSVVLLSYDVNLCTKAMIYDIVTLGRNDPLEKIDYLNASNYFSESFCNSNDIDRGRLSLESTSISNQELCVSNEIFEDIKSIVRDFLTVIVSKEMYVLYGESWEKYVIIRPPWTTVTVLQCAIKHWIAAVSESFVRKAEAILKELLKIFKDTSGKRTLKENSYILNKCSDLVEMVNIDKHSDLMLRVSTRINELKQKCYDCQSRINDQKLRDVIGVESNVDEEERRAQKAFQYFEAAYVYARDMCGLAAETVGMPCSFHYSIPSPHPTADYVKQIQPELAANVNRLLCSLSAVIEQVKKSCTDYRTLISLHQSLVTFLPKTTPTAMQLNDSDLVPLDVYCCVKRKEEVLKTGLRQLQELSTHFCRLASYRCI